MSTTTVYPDPNPESTTFDGWFRYSSTSWDTAHDATTALSSTNDSNTTLIIKAHNDLGTYRIDRAIFLFDISGVSDTDTISAATVQLYATGKGNDDNDGQDYLTILDSSPASNTAISANDFDLVGDAINNPTKLSDDVDFGSITTSAYNTWTLNATGLSRLSTAQAGSNIVKMGMREGHDQEDAPIADGGASDYGNDVTLSSADAADVTQDPKLVITHAAASVSAFLLLGIG